MNSAYQSQVQEIFAILDQSIPDPQIELEYCGNPYHLVISVLLSAQSTDKQVNKATIDLYKIVHTPEDMLALGHDKLIEHVNSIGLYNTKASNIMKLSARLIAFYNSVIPQTRDELMTLAGIGRKSADVILNALFGQPTVAVDTHVFRVCNRLGICDMNNHDKMATYLEAELPQHLDQAMMIKANQLLVLHGRYTCKAVNPKCTTCPLRHVCKFVAL